MSGERRIASDYFEVAKQILREQGHPALNVAELCRRLGASKGSFYHHFDSVPQFLEALLDEWENSFGHWWTTADTVWDPVERLDVMFDLLADEMTSRLDAAIRKWGHADPVAARAVARRDETVAYSLEQTLALIVADPTRRRMLAQLGLNVWVGFQVRGVDRADVLRLSVEVVRSCWGVECALVEESGRLVARVDPESVRRNLVLDRRP